MRDVRPPIGRWIVEHVAVDTLDGPMRWSVLPDDPSLVGRTFIVDEKRAYYTHAPNVGCTLPRWQAMDTTWKEVFRTGVARPEDGSLPQYPTPADYELELKLSEKLVVLLLCHAGERRTHPLSGPWIASQGADRLVMLESGPSLVFLKRAEPTGVIVASFPCANAGTLTEQAICGDAELASWDRSVASAFDRAKEQWSERAQALCSQRLWLAERDQCANDKECLSRSMMNRVGVLVQIIRSGPEGLDAESCGNSTGLGSATAPGG
jgi:uncharacterized protein YecT (DUF1311 family)